MHILEAVQCLSEHDLAFWGTNAKLYEKNNGNLLGLIDHWIWCHYACIRNKDTHAHYLGPHFQNEIIFLSTWLLCIRVVEVTIATPKLHFSLIAYIRWLIGANMLQWPKAFTLGEMQWLQKQRQNKKTCNVKNKCNNRNMLYRKNKYINSKRTANTEMMQSEKHSNSENKCNNNKKPAAFNTWEVNTMQPNIKKKTSLFMSPL